MSRVFLMTLVVVATARLYSGCLASHQPGSSSGLAPSDVSSGHPPGTSAESIAFSMSINQFIIEKPIVKLYLGDLEIKSSNLIFHLSFGNQTQGSEDVILLEAHGDTYSKLAVVGVALGQLNELAANSSKPFSVSVQQPVHQLFIKISYCGLAYTGSIKLDSTSEAAATIDISRQYKERCEDALAQLNAMSEVGDNVDEALATYAPISGVDSQPPKGFESRPTAVAVVIGNQNYEHTYPVQLAHRDAITVRSYLIDTFGLSEENIHLILDANLEELNEALGSTHDPAGWLQQHVDPGNSDVFVYYSGHGMASNDGGEPFLLSTGADPLRPAINGYSLKTLYANLLRVPYRSLTVVLDACFTGVGDLGPLVEDVSGFSIAPREESPPTGQVTVFTAGTALQTANWDLREQHGLLTYYLLKGIRGEADADRNLRITGDELGRYLLEQVGIAASALGRDQDPQVRGDRGRVIVSLSPQQKHRASWHSK